MAITLTDTPAEVREGETIYIFSTHNQLFFEFTAGAGEASLQVKVTDSGGTELGTIKTIPFESTGVLKVDVSYILKSLLSNTDYTLDTVNSPGVFDLIGGDGVIQPFKLEYRVAGTGAYTALAQIYNAMNASRQVGSTFGATMAEYWPILSTGAVVDFTGKFLTRFDKPVLFYSGSAIWNIGLAFLVPTDGFNVFDAVNISWQKNGVEVNGEIYEPATAITSNAVHIPIPEGETNAPLADTLFIQIGELQTGGIFGNALTENLEIEVKEVCQNPIGLRWLNTLGGFDTWVFEGNSPRELNVENEGDYGIVNEDLKTATATRGMTTKTAFPALTLTADNLTLQQAKGLEDLLLSPSVQVSIDSPYTWQSVTIEGGSFTSYDKYNRRHRLEVSINLVDINTISA